jgi:carbon-monoxide dehydrogenase medium subunit
MIPSAFEYFAANSVDEALKLLAEHGDEAKILAGGHSLLPAMKLRLAAPTVLIDINPIAELRSISVGEGVTIGAMTTYASLLDSAELKAALPVIGEAVDQIGDPQVRNRGTIGGALAHADPAADLPAVILALGGTLTAQGPEGTREIAIDDFFVDMLTTSLEPNELLTSISLPKTGAGEGASYVKMVQPASGYAIVGASAWVKLNGDGTVAAARVAITGAGPKPTRLEEVENALVGGASGQDAVTAAAEAISDDLELLGDIHASEDYRRAMVKVYVRRAILKAIEAAS